MDETEYGYVFMYIKLKSLLSAVCHSVDTVVIRQETGDRIQAYLTQNYSTDS